MIIILRRNKAPLIILSTIVAAVQRTRRHFVYVTLIIGSISALIGFSGVHIVAFVLLISQ